MLGTSYQNQGVKRNHKLLNIQLFGEWRSSFECQLTDLFNVRAEVKTLNYHPLRAKASLYSSVDKLLRKSV